MKKTWMFLTFLLGLLLSCGESSSETTKVVFNFAGNTVNSNIEPLGLPAEAGGGLVVWATNLTTGKISTILFDEPFREIPLPNGVYNFAFAAWEAPGFSSIVRCDHRLQVPLLGGVVDIAADLSEVGCSFPEIAPAGFFSGGGNYVLLNDIKLCNGTTGLGVSCTTPTNPRSIRFYVPAHPPLELPIARSLPFNSNVPHIDFCQDFASGVIAGNQFILAGIDTNMLFEVYDGAGCTGAPIRQSFYRPIDGPLYIASDGTSSDLYIGGIP